MPFKDTPDGQTHHANDGCIPPHVMNANSKDIKIPSNAERTGDTGRVNTSTTTCCKQCQCMLHNPPTAERSNKSYPLLEKAPIDHNSPKFLDFLRANNKVVYDSDSWLVIENCKYHTPEKPWLTAFWKGNKSGKIPEKIEGIKDREWYNDIDILWDEFRDYEWLKKSKSKQTIQRFHIHLIKK